MVPIPSICKFGIMLPYWFKMQQIWYYVHIGLKCNVWNMVGRIQWITEIIVTLLKLTVDQIELHTHFRLMSYGIGTYGHLLLYHCLWKKKLFLECRKMDPIFLLKYQVALLCLASMFVTVRHTSSVVECSFLV